MKQSTYNYVRFVIFVTAWQTLGHLPYTANMGLRYAQTLSYCSFNNSPVLKHNRHNIALVPSTSFCTLLYSYLNITPISLLSLHGRHGAERRAMLASNLVYNSPVIKHNRHDLELVHTTSFCTLLSSYINKGPINPLSLHGRHGFKRRAMLALIFVYNSTVLKQNTHG